MIVGEPLLTRPVPNTRRLAQRQIVQAFAFLIEPLISGVSCIL
jgi:hypothetical protein